MMDREVLDRIREMWRLELHAPGAFRRPGRHVQVRAEADASRAWVGVVTLAEVTCVSLPPGAAGRRDLEALGLDAELTDPAVFAQAIGAVRSLGPAILAFLDPATAAARDQPQVESLPASHAAVRRLAAACGPDAEESGLLAVDSPVAVWRAGDLVARSAATGLLPQWRARTTLLASRQIARSLGFVELGRQATYELPTPPPGAADKGS
jgi:hypothetical protein